ncbi:hypothetical protein LUZ62_028101 [Rhynchospora pubera]|uniref:Uncharacterized protein n=1 Tax=Rhynchospora pubera TaxID=906938 RepID=A0AAV8HI40_9POAL|nr:hypothetical protein LUZ62_028101 [Rhynchospora pubera]
MALGFEKMGKEDQNLNLEDKALKGAGNVVKLLPTGTGYAFQFLAPLLTNRTYVGIDKKLHYGIATWTGLWPLFDKNASALDFSSYKLKVRDFVHSFLALAVLAVLALLDTDSVSCFWPSMLNSQRILLKILPTVVGVLSTVVFMVFPNKRHGIGYPPSKVREDFSN